MKRVKPLGQNYHLIFSVMISFILIVLFVLIMVDTSEKRSEKELYDLDLSIRRAAVSCYALEGSYPQSLEYLENHYGIQIDYKRYNVFYEVFAENIMPEITVLERNNEK